MGKCSAVLSRRDREGQAPGFPAPPAAANQKRWQREGNPHLSLLLLECCSVALEKGNVGGPGSEISPYSQSRVLPQLEGLSICSVSLCIEC